MCSGDVGRFVRASLTGPAAAEALDSLLRSCKVLYVDAGRNYVRMHFLDPDSRVIKFEVSSEAPLTIDAEVVSRG